MSSQANNFKSSMQKAWRGVKGFKEENAVVVAKRRGAVQKRAVAWNGLHGEIKGVQAHRWVFPDGSLIDIIDDGSGVRPAGRLNYQKEAQKLDPSLRCSKGIGEDSFIRCYIIVNAQHDVIAEQPILNRFFGLSPSDFIGKTAEPVYAKLIDMAWKLAYDKLTAEKEAAIAPA